MEFVISKSYKFLYFPIAKNACTSLKYWVMGLEGYKVPNPHDVHEPSVVPQASRDELASLDYASYISFVVLREPYRRLLSAFLDKFVRARIKDPKKWEEGYWGEIARSIKSNGQISFAEFVNYVEPGSGHPWKADDHWKSQTLQCENFAFDICMDFDFLSDDMKLLFALCNIPYRVQSVPHLNWNPHVEETPNRGISSSLAYVPNSQLCLLDYWPARAFSRYELIDLVEVKYANDYALYNTKVRVRSTRIAS